MNSKSMANEIRRSNIKNCKDATSAMIEFWGAVKRYIENNFEATYSWTGFDSVSETTDPVTFVKCKVKTFGNISPCGLNTSNAALAAMSLQMNSNISTWNIVVDNSKSPGFSLSPAKIIPTISLKASNSTDPNDAIESICGQIINGIKKATVNISGTHGSYIGNGTFMSIN